MWASTSPHKIASPSCLLTGHVADPVHAMNNAGHYIWYNMLVITYGTICWSLHMVQYAGHYIWYNMLVITYGTICWSLHMVQYAGHYIWYNMLVITYGTICWSMSINRVLFLGKKRPFSYHFKLLCTCTYEISLSIMKLQRPNILFTHAFQLYHELWQSPQSACTTCTYIIFLFCKYNPMCQ